MILTDGDRMVLTPTYHVFKMYVPFQDATALPVQVDGRPQYTLGATSIPAISVSAARGKDGRLHLGLVNADPHEAVDVAVQVAGAKAVSAEGSVLTAAAMDAHNTAAAPDAVLPAPLRAAVDHGKLVVRLPPKSVAVLAIDE
jgi:alpha-N-arabinofuranosidase